MTRWVLALALLVSVTGCERQNRPYRNEPAPVANPYAKNAWGQSEGKRLYAWMNCDGCHAQGGGAIGPPLMDAAWIYGSDAETIHESIVDGRPNGMPAYRGKLPEQQIWQLVAYVRSMSGLAPIDVASGRNDQISVKRPESRTETVVPLDERESP